MNNNNQRKPAGIKVKFPLLLVLCLLFTAFFSLSCNFHNPWMEAILGKGKEEATEEGNDPVIDEADLPGSGIDEPGDPDSGKEKPEEPEDPYADYLLLGPDELELDGAGTIIAYKGPDGIKVRIPAEINGLPVTTIGNYAFNNNQLTGVVIPSSVTSIGSYAFNNNQLTGVVIPSSVTSIGSYAFQNNQLTSVIIPDSVTSIEMNTFYGNQLTSVTIPDSVTSIMYLAFAYNQLASVTIGNGVTYIGNLAFAENPITSVTFMGNGITSSGFVNSWIDDKGNLQTLYLAGGAGTYTRSDETSTVWAKE